jgi:flavin reductase (DIM6/NTAB) family NADH-FMN oxidoreductase RutF
MKKSIGADAVLYPAPVLVVGTYDAAGKANVLTVAWGGICCSNPPAIAISLRNSRHSYAALLERKMFTISIPSEQYAKQADYFGLVSGREVDKFAASGLTAVRSELVDAPYVKEFPLVLECKLIHTLELGSHTQFIGEVLDVKADEEMLIDGRVPDIYKLQPMLFSPKGHTYHGVGKYLGPAFSLGKQV